MTFIYIYNYEKILFITPASIYTVFFSSLQLLFMRYSFNHSNFYLCNILFITPASTYAVFFSSLQLLFIQFFLEVLSNTIVAELFASCEAVDLFTRSSNYQARLNNNRRSSEEFKTFLRSLQSFNLFLHISVISIGHSL